MKTTRASDPLPASPERGAWEMVADGWSQVYGSFNELGVSVESHDFHADTELDWSRSFHPQSVELCLNLSGRGQVALSGKNMDLQPLAVGCYAVAKEPLHARRIAGEAHRFVTLEFGYSFLERNFAGTESQVDPVVQRSVFSRRSGSAIGAATPMNDAQHALALSFTQAPVAPAALPLWYQSKVLEALSVFLFPSSGPELFCSRQKRLARERVERVRHILRERLETPPSLSELGREVGVSPFYLSRIFSTEMSMTIPQYLRRIRMERAAELLREGTHNVTEAAFAVGYSSLGHFSKSFCELIGCCPTLYPHARNLIIR